VQRPSAIMRPEVPRRVDLSSAPRRPVRNPVSAPPPIPSSPSTLARFFPLSFSLSSFLSFFFFFLLCLCFVPMRNTRDVHGRVRRLCRLYFTLCPVRKRIISSLIFGNRRDRRGAGGRAVGALVLSSLSIAPCVLARSSLSLSLSLSLLFSLSR